MKAHPLRWYGVVTLFIVAAISYIDRINISVLVTDHSFLDHFELLSGDRVRQGALATLFMIGYGLSSILLTPICSAILGVRNSLLMGLLFWGGVTFITPIAHSYGFLLVSRFLLGVSEGPFYSLAANYIKSHFGIRESGKPNSFVNMGTGIGLAVGYPLVSHLLADYSWSTSFHLIGLLNITVGIPLVLALIRTPHSATEPISKKSSWKQLKGVVTGALHTRHLILVTVITSAALAYLWGSGNWLPAYLKLSRNFSLREMGWVASLPQYALVVGVFAGGMALDKIKPSSVPFLFMFGSLGVALSVWITIQSGDRYLAVSGMIAANFFWGFQAPAIPSTIQFNSRVEHTASAFGIVNGVGSLIAAFMPVMMGNVIQSVSNGRGGITSGFYAGFSLLIGTQAVVFLCGLFLWLQIRRSASLTSLSARG